MARDVSLERCPCGQPSTHIVTGEDFVTQRCAPCAEKMAALGWTIRETPGGDDE